MSKHVGDGRGFSAADTVNREAHALRLGHAGLAALEGDGTARWQGAQLPQRVK